LTAMISLIPFFLTLTGTFVIWDAYIISFIHLSHTVLFRPLSWKNREGEHVIVRRHDACRWNTHSSHSHSFRCHLISPPSALIRFRRIVKYLWKWRCLPQTPHFFCLFPLMFTSSCLIFVFFCRL
jgi:hypothetical protein